MYAYANTERGLHGKYVHQHAFGQSESLTLPTSPLAGSGTCYTALQPVTMDSLSLGSLITTSTSCLSGDMCSSGSPGYAVDLTSQAYYTSYASDDSVPPHSPESVYEETLLDIEEILYHRPCDIDDDDKSVVFDFKDLDFLDQNSDSGSQGGNQYPTTIVSEVTEYLPQQLHSKPSPHLHATAATTSTAHNNHHHHQHHHHHHQHQHHQQLHLLASSLSSPSSSSTTPYDRGNITILHRHDDRGVIFPPTPSQSPLPHVPTAKHHHHQQQYSVVNTAKLQHAFSVPPVIKAEEEEDDDDDAEYKPYCDSRRGAKKNLLWKFLLWVLENHPELAQWINLKLGEFRFMDTARVSDMWGRRKQKRDMTFEKLSRGIRHYYKRGLMERLPNTRLVYKFNWEKVPKRYRKA